MKVVIDIPDELVNDTSIVAVDVNYIKNGQVLPKGHGDLIDANALIETFENLSSDSYESPLWYEDTVFRVIETAPTVIEADRNAIHQN